LEASAAARIQAIPPANPEKYRNLADMRNWRNPYITIRTDGVGLLDADNHEVHLLKPEELPQALAKLPPSAWPYGRVVGVSVVAVQSPEEAVLIRKNRGIVAGTLESMKVTINWVPSA
jgi:hypothetical protein